MEVRWRKSSRSNSGSTCVEIAHTRTAIRDSKNPDGPQLAISEQQLDGLLSQVKAGSFSR